MRQSVLLYSAIFIISFTNICESNAEKSVRIKTPFDINSEDVQAVLLTIRKDMISYSLTEIMIDFLEELYILTHHKTVHYKSTDIFEIIHVIENADLQLSDLMVMRDQLLQLISKHPDIQTMKHLKKHIILDFAKVTDFLDERFEEFINDLKMVKSVESIYRRIQHFRTQDGNTMGIMTVFYYWFEGIMYPRDTMLWVRKIRQILLRRLKLEKIMWQIN